MIEPTVAVIGAGIGGLATTLALRARGVDAHVFEQASALAPVGAALVVRGASIELMQPWADTDHFDRTAVRIEVTEFYPIDGSPARVATAAVDADDEDWAYSIHRADLFEALHNPLPDDVVHLGRRAVRIEQDADGAVIILADGESVRTHAVVAADGIRSVVRPAIAGADTAVFSGTVACRSVVSADLLGGLSNDRIRTWFSPGMTFSTFPVRGGSQVAFDAASMDVVKVEESWNAMIELDQIVPSYKEFPDIVQRILNAAHGPISAYGLHDREPISTWTDGRIALLGDAAHPMLPFLGQGANQAIQDAVVIADHLVPALASGGDVAAALRAYEAERAPRTRHYQEGSRQLPEAMR